jgi:signal transduction histidine kinase
MRWRIRSQLLVPLVLLLLGVVGISTWTAVASANRAWQQLETRFRSVARTLSETSYPLNQKNILKIMKGLSGAEYLLVPANGKPITTFADPDIELPPAEAVVEDWEALHLGPRVTVAGETYLCSGLLLRLPSSGTPATFYILYPEALWRDALWEAVWPSLILGGLAGLASVLLTLGVAQRLGRRILELERRTRLIAAGDFSPMPLPRRDDEIRDLVRSINEMAQQLTRLQDTVQKTERLRLLGQVSGGLAHQLRNGITGARLAVQVHAREYSGATDSEPLEVALRQLTLLEVHLKRFLELGDPRLHKRERCSLTALIGEVVRLLGPQCRHGRIDLRWQPPQSDLNVLGDRGQLEQLLLNVISNGIEAAGPGGWVSVEAEWRPAGPCVIAVSDSGPGPPAALAPRLFEPFVTSKPEGVGLGLAVARQVAEAHGGRVDWQRGPDPTCFRIELPLEKTT